MRLRKRLAALFAVGCMGLAAVSAQATAGVVHVATRAPRGDGATGSAGPALTRALRVRAGSSTAHFTSRNWDGYITYVASEGTDFKVVKASWVQPKVTCTKTNAWAVFWVGLDGWWNDTVEQGGTSAECLNGVPDYTAWWEMYPTNAITNVFTIKAGDSITSSVTYETATKTFVIVVKDVTSGRSLTENEKCASNVTCDRSSADVIAEDVGHYGSGTYFPLADYGQMAFSAARVTDDAGHSGGIADANWLDAAVTEAAGGVTYATVSGLTMGDAFTATWKHA